MISGLSLAVEACAAACATPFGSASLGSLTRAAIAKAAYTVRVLCLPLQQHYHARSMHTALPHRPSVTTTCRVAAIIDGRQGLGQPLGCTLQAAGFFPIKTPWQEACKNPTTQKPC